MHKYRNTIIWSMMGVVIILFWVSLRSPDLQMEFTLAAIGMWGITFLVNRKLKNEEDQKEE